MIEIDYLTQIQCYRNSSIDIDAFVFHQGMTQWYHALIIRALRRVLKKEYGIEFKLIDMFNTIEESYKLNSDMVIKDILEKENYLGKRIRYFRKRKLFGKKNYSNPGFKCSC